MKVGVDRRAWRAAWLLWAGLAACTPGTPDLQGEREALERVRAGHRVAHLERDPELLVSSFADGFLGIQEGRLTSPSREENLRRFRGYLEGTEILAWDDVEPPIIRLSADATMAWVAVRKRVVVRPAGTAEDSAAGGETTFAWLETWEKRDGEWKLQALASTRAPASDPRPGSE